MEDTDTVWDCPKHYRNASPSDKKDARARVYPSTRGVDYSTKRMRNVASTAIKCRLCHEHAGGARELHKPL